LWISIILPGSLSGQTIDEGTVEFEDITQNFAPVKLDGDVLFYVTGIASYTAEQRAAAISERIKKIAADYSISPDSLKIVKVEDRAKIGVGDFLILNVFEADVKNKGISMKGMADFMVYKTVLAIDSYRNNRSRPVLLNNLLHALGAAALMTVILFILLWLIRRLNVFLLNRFKMRIEQVDSKSFNLIKSNQLWKAIQISFKTLKIIVILFIIASFLQYILGLFPWTKHIATYTLDLVLDPVRKLWIGFIGFIPSLVFLIVLFVVTRYLLKLIKLFFTGIENGGIVIHDFDNDLAMPTFKILRFFIIAFAIVVAYPYIPGSDSNAFKGVTVFLGILFSLGSSSFISNLIAGYSMTYRGAYKNGDLIKLDDYIGFVEEQRLLITRLRSFKNEEIVIPNSLLLNSNIINYSKRANELGLILHTVVGIGYETPWRQVDAMLKLAADRTEGLLKQPPPYVLKKSLGDFAVNYEINAYCSDVANMNVIYTTLHQHILDVFNENNVQIMTPAYEGDPEIPKVVPKDQWFTPLAGEGN
jgi:small-conductance mechanosensitive channel